MMQMMHQGEVTWQRKQKLSYARRLEKKTGTGSAAGREKVFGVSLDSLSEEYWWP